MDFNNMVDQLCMLAGLSQKYAVAFKRMRYIDIEIQGKQIFYLQERQFYGYITNPETDKQEVYNIKTPLEFSNMLYELNLLMDKYKDTGEEKHLFIFKNQDYHMLDFHIVDAAEKKEIKDFLFCLDEGEHLFDIEVKKEYGYGYELELEVTSSNFFFLKITSQESKSLISVFGGCPSNICKNFFKYVTEYNGEDYIKERMEEE